MVESEAGTITAWFSSRGYGFITGSNDAPGARRVFCHKTAVISGEPAPGRRVTFKRLAGDKGVFSADVAVDDGRRRAT